MAIAPEHLPAAGATFDSTDPATGAVVGTFPVHGPDDVRAAVARARHAATWWADLGFDGRRQRLNAYKAELARRSLELCDLVQRENGKALDDAYIEAILVVEHLNWAARNARRVLGPRRVRSTLNQANIAASLEYRPVGVVGVIGPWNYPVHTTMGSVSYALAAGNAVVLKPSEFTPAVGAWLAEVFATVVPEQPVFQVVTGFGDTGAALCRAGVDHVAFTGSAATGRKVMAACAETLTPVTIEAGGKDAFIVAGDADLDAAAKAALWGGCANAGQTCAGVERIYVVEAVYDEFVERLTHHAGLVRAGGEDARIGPITMPAQLDVIASHLTDAFERGAKALVGGPESVHPPFVDPVVLVDVPDDARMMREETFGPILPVARVRDIDEAVERANDSPYALGSTVYAKRGGMAIARRLDAGMTSVNSLLGYAAIPGLPFGGRGESGYGRIHGEDGLRAFASAKAITRERFRLPVDVYTFDRPVWLFPLIDRAMKLRHGRRRRT
jgi:acyl-CoA reductase-like NAD-dependent aldehyde dehydrogenase